MTNATEQLEMMLDRTMANLAAKPAAGRRERRLTRANWWFARMRQAVDRAFDWAPVPPPRPEQIYFPE
jgi:hypothetical protein